MRLHCSSALITLAIPVQMSVTTVLLSSTKAELSAPPSQSLEQRSQSPVVNVPMPEAPALQSTTNRQAVVPNETSPVVQTPRAAVSESPAVTQPTRAALPPEVVPSRPEQNRPEQNQADRAPVSQAKPAEIANQPRPVETAINPTMREAPKIAPALVEPSDNRTRPQPVQQVNQPPLRTADTNAIQKPINESVAKSDTAAVSQAVKPMTTPTQEQNTGRVLPPASDTRSIDPRSIQSTGSGSRVEQSSVSGAIAPQKTDVPADAKVSTNKQDAVGGRLEPDRSSTGAGNGTSADRSPTATGGSDIRTQPADRITSATTSTDGRSQPGKQPTSDATAGNDIAQGTRVPAAGDGTVSGGNGGAAGGRIPDARIEPPVAISGGTDMGIRGYVPVEKEVVFDQKEEPSDRQVRAPEEPVSRTLTPAREAEIRITEQFGDRESRSELLTAIRKLEQGKTDDQPTRIVDLTNVLSLIEPIKLQQIKEILIKEVVGKGDEKAEQILVKQLMAIFPKDEEIPHTFKDLKTEIVEVEEETESNKGKAQVVAQLQAMILRAQGKRVDLYKDAAEKFDELKAQTTQDAGAPKVDHRHRYIVKEGDTLKSIAKQKLKDALLADLILEINRSVITTPIGKPLTAKLVILLPTAVDIAEYKKRTEESTS